MVIDRDVAVPYRFGHHPGGRLPAGGRGGCRAGRGLVALRQAQSGSHGRKKWGYYYEPESVERQRAFFDQFLRGVDRGVLDWPRVRMEVRERYYQGTHRVATGWPPKDTEYRSWHLDAGDGAMLAHLPAAAAVAEYDSLGSAPGRWMPGRGRLAASLAPRA
jgi:predicted acyl esterase